MTLDLLRGKRAIQHDGGTTVPPAAPLPATPRAGSFASLPYDSFANRDFTVTARFTVSYILLRLSVSARRYDMSSFGTLSCPTAHPRLQQMRSRCCIREILSSTTHNEPHHSVGVCMLADGRAARTAERCVGGDYCARSALIKLWRFSGST